MVKNFLLKRGDQLAFTITFTSPTPVTAMEFGVKEHYSDTNYTLIESLYEVKRKVVFIGDSYAEGYTPDGKVNGWPAVIKANRNLDDSIIKYKGGTGFSPEIIVGSFAELLSELDSDNEVTDVVVAGGWNDSFANEQAIKQGITEFCNISRRKFPKATINIGMIGWDLSSERQSYLNETIATYKAGCIENKVTYMEDAQNSLHGKTTYFSSDGFHPNQLGENEIAKNISLYIPVEYGGGITKISDNKYRIVVSSDKTSKLNIQNYVYDLRMKIGKVIRTPLSGKLMIKDTVFED